MRVWKEIKLDAVKNNVKNIRGLLKDGTRLLAVIKADAYGHGAVEVAKSLLFDGGADYFGVATYGEAEQLRRAGINTPVLILGAVFGDEYAELVKDNITLTVFDFDTAKKLSDTAKKLGKTAKIHIKIDTGMARIGFLPSEDAVEEIIKISKLDGIEIEGMFSHFAKADEADKMPTRVQFEKFMFIKNELLKRGIKIPICHICNSAGIIDFPEYHLDMVRSGIITYGYYPSDFVNKDALKLESAMSFKSRVVHIKTVEAGTSVSYGGTFTAKEKMKIATVSAGYADGYNRLLSNKADVIINGERCRVLGRVCMDQLMVDATHLKNINLGDEVILFGKSGNNTVTVEETAEIIGTINYEVLCSLSKRVPGVYIHGA
ncbi:alanine racemase [Qingrenia yutianensis]|uniref:Alanine racemase n=1 Tax=Qingrenia yutianensis TaxID=2763676 RepID=A0A926FC70_9FIRM|nr:alanine racemase [Qingrenia yutianensis]MBC8596582.1 alanine racemase [Qingrenia yutianensis]